MTKTTSLGNGDERREKLMKMLRSRPDDAACRLCLDNLGSYVTSQLAGEDYLSRFPVIATHLDSCPECTGAYARIYGLEFAEISGHWFQPAQIPEPDLSFLKRRSVLSLLDLWQQAVRQWADGFSLQLTAELQQLLHPSLPVAQLRQSPMRQSQYGELILQFPPDPMPETESPVSITVFKDTQNLGMCLVEITVTPPGRSWPYLDGSTVTLRIDEEEKMAGTDHNGLAAFTAVPIDALETLGIEVAFNV